MVSQLRGEWRAGVERECDVAGGACDVGSRVFGDVQEELHHATEARVEAAMVLGVDSFEKSWSHRCVEVRWLLFCRMERIVVGV